MVSDGFSIGLDLLTIVNETPAQACVTYDHMDYLNDFSWYMENVPGVRSVTSAAYLAKQINAGWNEGNLKFRALPRNSDALSQAIGPIPTSSGLLDYNCTMLPVQVFTIDSKATTLKTVVAAAKQWRTERGIPPVLGQEGKPKLGLGDAADDICWVERDGRDGSWTLDPADLNALTFTRPPASEDTFTVTVTGLNRERREENTWTDQISVITGLEAVRCPFERPKLGRVAETRAEGEQVFTLDIPVTAGEVGATQKLDILGAMKAQGIDMGAATEVKLEGVPNGFNIRLASGNAGVTAAVNETIAASELPSILIVYVAVILLTYFTYFDWRAALGCVLPLTFSTFFGYYFMLKLDIGLKVATLPVIVLVVGVGVDYAYYIYNRLQYHLSKGHNITRAYQETILETGNGVFFTALNFAIGVSTWSFSPLKFQADMGLLMTFMFITNMVMALTALPALAVVIDKIFPRSKLPYAGPEPGGHWQ
jgi:predicted RND superfamily exporter protein